MYMFTTQNLRFIFQDIFASGERTASQTHPNLKSGHKVGWVLRQAEQKKGAAAEVRVMSEHSARAFTNAGLQSRVMWHCDSHIYSTR